VVVDGTRSGPVSVKSGVPQGSVLGPSLFLVYINDLPHGLTSRTRLFADDTALHRQVATKQDQKELQTDLDKLEIWEDRWAMQFHPDKCSTLRVSRKQNRMEKFEYKLHGHTLTNEEEIKYLGVTLRHDLSWDCHINNICTKANKTLGFLRRNLKVGTQHLKETAYKTFVRPILEYASCVWDPYTQGNKDKLEAVQRRAARFVCNKYHRTASVTDMIDHLGWPSLEQRRKTARLAMLFKIRNELVQVDKNMTKENLGERHIRSRRVQHNKQYFEHNTFKQDYRLGSFFPKTVKNWNALSQKIVDAESLDTFVSRVNREN